MTDVQITVRGSARETCPPERATVHVAVMTEGPDREHVHRAASESADRLRSGLAPLFDRERGPITWWVSEQVQLWTDSRHLGHDTASPIEQRHRAVVDFRIRFSDFHALGSWLAAVAPDPHVSVRHVEWSLTGERSDELAGRARTAAVRDAQQRAAGYAADLGLGGLRPVAVADPGLLADHPPSGDRLLRAEFAASSDAGPGFDVRLSPQDIEVSASVDMRFVAS